MDTMEPKSTLPKTYVKRYYFLHDVVMFMIASFLTYLFLSGAPMLKAGGNLLSFTILVSLALTFSILSRLFYVYFDSKGYQQTSLVTKSFISAILLSIIDISVIIFLLYMTATAFIFSSF